jgi:uncharacterized iron-regulated protein
MTIRNPILAAAVSAVTAALLVTMSLTGARADNRDVLPWPSEWTAAEGRDHPLVGRIWSRAAGGLVSPQEYGTALARSRFILLGEHHDNADHHRLQAWAIATVSKLRGARLVEGAPQADAVAFEMLTPDQQEALDKFYGRNAKVPRTRTASDFGRIVKWETLGWPDFKTYEPIVAAALDAQLQIVAANPAREETRKAGREGAAGLAGDDVRRLGLDPPLEAKLAADLAEEIEESHCGMLPATALPNMSLVQRLRDARMADALLAVGEWKGAFLIAGNGHVRRDRGVPLYLARRGIAEVGVQVTSVMHVEVTAGKDRIEDYLDDGNDALADYIVLTARHARPDPCEEMRRQMERMRAQKKPSAG